MLKAMPKVMRMTAKCSDLFSAVFEDSNGKDVASYSGYVPGFMPNEHFGDYVDITIDLATGKILDWKAPSLKAINTLFEVQS